MIPAPEDRDILLTQVFYITKVQEEDNEKDKTFFSNAADADTLCE